MRLKDKVSIITGGARGIGKSTVTKFCAEGRKLSSGIFSKMKAMLLQKK